MKRTFVKTLTLAVIMLMGMATVSVAQSNQYSGGPKTTPGSVDASVDSLQVDYVTVGAIMPYSTDTTSSNALKQWMQDLNAAGLSANLTRSVNWYLNDVEIADAANKATFFMSWGVKGEQTLKVQQTLKLGGQVACGDAVSTKKVYVLDKPSVSIAAANAAKVVDCSTTSVDLTYGVTGIGAKQIGYTVTRKPFGGVAAADAAAADTVGAGVTNADEFVASVSIATANAKYSTPVDQTLTLDNLESGFVYTVTLNDVSDQISRKSFTGNGAKTTLTANNVFTVLVTPAPVSKKIQHVKNIEE